MKIIFILLCLAVKVNISLVLSCKGFWEKTEHLDALSHDKEKATRYFANEINRRIGYLNFNLNNMKGTEEVDQDDEERIDDLEDLIRSDAGIYRRLQILRRGNVLLNNDVRQASKAINFVSSKKDDPDNPQKLNQLPVNARKRRLLEGSNNVETQSDSASSNPKVDQPQTKSENQDTDAQSRIHHTSHNADADKKETKTNILVTCVIDGDFMQEIQTIDISCSKKIEKYVHFIKLGNGDNERYTFNLDTDVGQIEFKRELSNVQYLSFVSDRKNCEAMHFKTASIATAALLLLIGFILF